jgi:hypothetical protein
VARVASSMFRASRVLAPISTLAIVALGGGCGGGSDQVSAAELVQKGDAICREERASFARVQVHPPANASVAADQTGELIQATERATSALRDLEPPDQLRSGYERYLEARDRVIDQMKRGRDAAENQVSAAYGAAQAAVAREAPERHHLARALGLKVCGSGRSGP